MADDYTRGYGKGYTAGKRSGYRFMDRLIRIAKEQRERAERAERNAGLGTCKECRHWRRGPERETNDRTGYHWGLCGRFGQGSEGVDQPWFGDYREAVSTQEHFGCVLFDPRPPGGGVAR